MHGYIKANTPIEFIYFCLGVISIILSVCIGYFIKGIRVIDFTDYLYIIFAGMPLGIYKLLYILFDKWLWKFSAKWLRIANLNGKYEGIFKTSYDNFQKERKFTLVIEQTFSKISIKFQTDLSSSESFSAYMEIKGNNTVILVYNYHNKPRIKSISTLTEHKGTAWLEFDLSTMKFEGFYYTDKRPKDKEKAECNYGEMRGEKII